MDITLTNVRARIATDDELIRNDGGTQSVPAGRVILEIPGGFQAVMSRERFEDVAGGDVKLDPDTYTYFVEGEDGPDTPYDPTPRYGDLDPRFTPGSQPVVGTAEGGTGTPDPANADATPPEGEEYDDFPADGTIAEVEEWVGDDAGRARHALAVEQGKGDKARSTLVEKLEAQVAAHDEEQASVGNPDGQEGPGAG